MELTLIIVLCANLPASKLPAFVKTVDGIEGAEDGLEVDVYDAVLVLLVQLHVLNWAKLA